MSITFQKRQKELRRQEKQRAKAERREQRKAAKRAEEAQRTPTTPSSDAAQQLQSDNKQRVPDNGSHFRNRIRKGHHHRCYRLWPAERRHSETLFQGRMQLSAWIALRPFLRLLTRSKR